MRSEKEESFIVGLYKERLMRGSLLGGPSAMTQELLDEIDPKTISVNLGSNRFFYP